MRVRVLVARGRPAVSVTVEEGSTIGRVREAVTAVRNVCEHFELSLNGRDCLDSSRTLEELGIVSGDLLYVLHWEPRTNDVQELSHVTGHVINGAAHVWETGQDTTSCSSKESVSETVAMNDPQVQSSVGPKSVMEYRHGHQYTSTNMECECEPTVKGSSTVMGQTANQMECEQNTVCAASSLELRQDGMEPGHKCACSTPESSTPVPQSRFDCLLDGSYPIAAEQYGVPVLCLALHMLMLDAGFLPSKSCPDGVGVTSSSGVYRWDYSTAIYAEVGVSLVCAEMGPTLVLHARATGLEGHDDISSSLQLNISTYVNTGPPNTPAAPTRLLQSGKQLSRIFKDAIAHRMNTEIRKAVGLPEVGTFMSLFSEVKLLVMRQLTSAGLVSLSRVCRELYVLSQDGFLWRDLLFRDFGQRASTKKDENVSWKEFYVQLYRQRLEERESRRLLSLDMEPRRLAPEVVYPPGFRIPGVIGGDYDRLPSLFTPPTYLPSFVGRQLNPRSRRDPWDRVLSTGAPDSDWRMPRLAARHFSHLSFQHSVSRYGF